MNIKDKVKGKVTAWSIEAFTDEKYKLRRAILIPIIKNKIDEWCKEDKMDTNELPKPWYKSKAKVAAIVTALVGIIQPVSMALGHELVVPDWILQALIGLGIYGVRDAMKK